MFWNIRCTQKPWRIRALGWFLELFVDYLWLIKPVSLIDFLNYIFKGVDRNVELTIPLTTPVNPEAYSELEQNIEGRFFPKIINGFQLLTTFAKGFILDVWLGSDYAFGTNWILNLIWKKLLRWRKNFFYQLSDKFSGLLTRYED